MVETLVLGLGNILLRDEGVGVRVVERLLAQYTFPEGVQAMDGGTLGLDLLPHLQDAGRLLVVDALQARQPAGTLVRLVGKEVPMFLDASRVSPHQDGLHDLLAVAMLKGYLPAEVVLWGVQVGTLGVGLELSSAVAAQIDMLVEKVIEELHRWGIDVGKKGDSSQPDHVSPGEPSPLRPYGGLLPASIV
jgi:hydrogenase maturation protease